MPRETFLKKNKSNPFWELEDRRFSCSFSTRTFGNMSLFYAETNESLSNRKNFLEGLGIDYRDLVCAKQVHGSCIIRVKEEDRGKGALSYDNSIPDTDALVTKERGLPLAVFTADCLSIFLYDSKTPAIGLVHAGWRSTKENITSKTIQLMQESFNTQAWRLHIGFGPAIRQCCYEVGKDFPSFSSEGLIKRNDRYYLDLVGINKNEALDSGVIEENIIDLGLCTSCSNEDFFSYRREGEVCGRMISVIMLR